MSYAPLRRRWLTPNGKLEQIQAYRWLAGAAAEPRGFGEHQGRIDLRGLQIEDAAIRSEISAGSNSFVLTEGGVHIKGATWASIDLTAARLPHFRFTAVSIENCIFDSADCRDWRLWDAQIDTSSFVRADLRDAALATWHMGKTVRWRHTSFDQADLRDAVAIGGSFRQCSFRSSRLRNVEFQQSHIEDCVFAGKLENVIFDGRDIPDRQAASPFEHVSFAASTFEDVEFRGCRFNGVELPGGGGIRLIKGYPQVARLALASAEKSSSIESRMIVSELRNSLKWPGREDSVGVFNRRDYVAAGGESLADYAEALLMEAEASIADRLG